MKNATDLLATHRAALAQYEAEADELERIGADITAAMFRTQAARRRALIEKLEQEQNGKDEQTESDELCPHQSDATNQ